MCVFRPKLDTDSGASRSPVPVEPDHRAAPVVTITVPVPADVGEHAVIGEDVTHRLAQRPGSYVPTSRTGRGTALTRDLDAVGAAGGGIAGTDCGGVAGACAAVDDLGR